MKKITLLLFIAALSFGCSDNDNAPTETTRFYEGSLIGEWKILSGKEDNISFDTSNDNCSETSQHIRENYIFKTDGKYQKIERCNRSNFSTGDYTFSNHNLTVGITGVISISLIVEDLGDNKIKIRNTNSNENIEILQKI